MDRWKKYACKELMNPIFFARIAISNYTRHVYPYSDNYYFIHCLSIVCSNDNWIWTSGWDTMMRKYIYITCVKGIWNEISIRKVLKSLCRRAINRWRKTWVGCEIIYMDRLNTKSEIWARSLRRRIEKELKFLSSFLSSNHFS